MFGGIIAGSIVTVALENGGTNWVWLGCGLGAGAGAAVAQASGTWPRKQRS